MTKQDPRFAQKITDGRARELYAECVERLYEYQHGRPPSLPPIAPAGSDERPRYSIDVLELGQILNEFISGRTALAMSDPEAVMAAARDILSENAALAKRINEDAKQIVKSLKEWVEEGKKA